MDDHPSIQIFFEKFFEESNFTIVAQAYSVEEAIEQYTGEAFNLIILELHLSGMSGESLLKFHKRVGSNMPIVLFTGVQDPERLNYCFQLGALFCVPKASPIPLLSEAMSKMEHWLKTHPRFTHTISLKKRVYKSKLVKEKIILTARELEVASGIAMSKTSKQIAEKLHISVCTVNIHRTNLMRKLGIKDSAAVTRYILSQQNL